MSGLVNGLQNRLQQFESARHLPTNSRNPDKQMVSGVYFFHQVKICIKNVSKIVARQPPRYRNSIDISSHDVTSHHSLCFTCGCKGNTIYDTENLIKVKCELDRFLWCCPGANNIPLQHGSQGWKQNVPRLS